MSTSPSSRGRAHPVHLSVRLRPAVESEPPYDEPAYGDPAPAVPPPHVGRRPGAPSVPRLRVVRTEPPGSRGVDAPAPVAVRRLQPAPRATSARAPEAAGPATPTGRASRADRALASPVALGSPQLRPPTPPGVARDAARRAGVLTRAVLEVLCGDRPLRQLAPWVTAEVYEQLEPLVGTRAARPWAATLRRLRVCLPSPAAAEVAAVVDRGGRSAAVALRLDLHDGRWRLTALTLG